MCYKILLLIHKDRLLLKVAICLNWFRVALHHWSYGGTFWIRHQGREVIVSWFVDGQTVLFFF